MIFAYIFLIVIIYIVAAIVYTVMFSMQKNTNYTAVHTSYMTMQ